MIKRATCLCDGELIGIESIYTIIDGKQINIPEKLIPLRKKSRNSELYCPCGCGLNLILVAGPKGERRQHFKQKAGQDNFNCIAKLETLTSINSKIVIKCWLDDKINDNDLISRATISSNTTNKQYEATFLSKDRHIAAIYFHKANSISEDKIDFLENNLVDTTILYIADQDNIGTNGQYPEYLMRIQERQGYNIILHVDSDDYYKAKFSITYNIKDIDGLWKTLQVVSDSLSNIEIDPNNKLIYKNQLVEDIVNLKKIEFAKEQEEIRKKREEELKKAIKRREEMQKILQKQKKTASYNQPEREEVIKNKPLSKVPPIRVDNSKWTKERYETECPKCGGRLVERNSYKGAFIGCRNYPACDFTRETAKKK